MQDRWWGGAEYLQGALEGGGEDMRARSRWWPTTGGDEQGKIQGALRGGGEEG